LLLAWPWLARAEWMDRSHTIFLPPSIHESLNLQMEFPTMWWNFAVIDPVNGVSDFARAEAVCRGVTPLVGDLLLKTGCPDVKSFMPLLSDWSHDLFLRQTYPGAEKLRDALASARAKASLPMDRDLLNVLRGDPLETYMELKHLMMKNVEIGLTQEKGFFVDPRTKKIAIPLQFAFAPQETDKSHTITAAVTGAGGAVLIGPHMSAAENESRVRHDVDLITWIGAAITVLQLLFIVVTRRYNYLWLIPPVVVGVGGAIGLTILIFGSIHGLTLSLGTGLIGLALDFGLHSAHNIHWRGVWRANLFGLLTTFAGLLAISLSGIPLLRQMMVFASLGLIISYSLYYWMHSRFPERFQVRAFHIHPRLNKVKTTLALAFAAMSVVGLTFLRPNLNMNQFDYQTPSTHDNLIWLYSLINKQMPLFSVGRHDEKMFATAEKQTAWASEHGVALSNFAQFIPDPDKQYANAATWRSRCAEMPRDPVDQSLFKPFFGAWPCQDIAVHQSNTIQRAYLRDIVSNDHWLTIWYPTSDAQIEAIKHYDTESYSLKDVVQQFPTTLGAELRWMLPLSLGLCFLLLLGYYRKLGPSLISLIPFLSGVGLYFACVVVLGLGFSFISIISLIMIFGFSIDYGIFATNLYILDDPPEENGVWTCLLFAALATLLGFLPLVFCHHPVLIHLGQTLVVGTVGTLLGTIWGIPGLCELLGYKKGRP